MAPAVVGGAAPGDTGRVPTGACCHAPPCVMPGWTTPSAIMQAGYWPWTGPHNQAHGPNGAGGTGVPNSLS